MAKGRLNNTEKYAIQGMLHEGLEIEQIATNLGRSVKAVENYVNGELDHMLERLAKVEVKKAEKEVERLEEYDEFVDHNENTINTVLRDLTKAGLTNQDANRVMNSALARADKAGIRYGKGKKDVARLYKDCIGRMTAANFMIKKTQGGQEGVTIMSRGASERGDDASKRNRQKTTRASRGNVFDIKRGKMIDD